MEKQETWFQVHGRHSVMAATMNQEHDTSAFVVPLPCNDEFQMHDSPVMKTRVLHMHRTAKDASAKLNSQSRGFLDHLQVIPGRVIDLWHLRSVGLRGAAGPQHLLLGMTARV